MTDGFAWLFRALKVQPEKANRLAALQTVLILTLIEFPMDAYNPSQGMGLTDLAADYAGVGWGLLKKEHPNNFDMKFCVKQPPWKFKHKLLASDNAEFDNFIWWGVWKPKYVWTGIGYSTNHDQPMSNRKFISVLEQRFMICCSLSHQRSLLRSSRWIPILSVSDFACSLPMPVFSESKCD